MAGFVYVSGDFRDIEYDIKSGVTALAVGDAVLVDQSVGKVALTTEGGFIAGIIENAYPSDAKNTQWWLGRPNTKAKVLVPDDETVFSIESDTTPAQASVGNFANLDVSGGSGTMKLKASTIATAPSSANTSTGAISRLQVAIIGIDPSNSKNYLVTISNLQLAR